jgi:two-component system, OmpR family, response regulator RegX3
MRVLLVEDDDSIGDPLAAALAKEGFDVDRARTAAEASAADAGVDLVLLDLGLPDGDGFDVCRSMRARSSVPIIVVTARGEEVDRVVGLELGADDYVVKPFGQRELLARIRAVLRRATPGADDPLVRVGALEIDRRSRRVSVAGADVTLTRKEYDLLALLAEDAGAVRTRDEILERVWDPHWYGPTKTLDVHVASLRRKLGDPTLVETVRGVGFRLRADG